MNYKNRIVGHGEESPEQLLANPFNFRHHPKEQKKAMDGALKEIGWVQNVVVNQNTGHIIDGHLRVELGIEKKEASIPVVYVDLTPEEEKIALATLDPIGALAEQDQSELNFLIEQISDVNNADLQNLLDMLYQEEVPTDEEEAEEAKESLQQRFLMPPFSVLDARRGEWVDRKRLWLKLGIKSELGRATNGDNTKKGLIFSVSSQSPEVYEIKNKLEKELGRPISWPEFVEQYPEHITLSGTSIFDPVLTELMYLWYAPEGGNIIDPFAGGSVRGIVAGFLGYNYTGIELRQEQVEENKKQGLSILDATGNHTANWITDDSRNILEHVEPGTQDLFFMCPPYADLEVYSDDPNDLSTLDYPEFIEAYRDIITKTCATLKDDAFAVAIVGEVRGKKGEYYGFVQDTIQAFKDAGMIYYNEAILLTQVASLAIRVNKMFTVGRKLGKTHQNALIFKKGDPKLGEVKEVASSLNQHFTEHRRLFEVAENILVFAKGDPKKATERMGEIDPCDLHDLLGEIGNEE